MIGGIVFVALAVVIFFTRNWIKQGFVKLFAIIKEKLGVK
jgi:hypothetical protein